MVANALERREFEAVVVEEEVVEGGGATPRSFDDVDWEFESWWLKRIRQVRSVQGWLGGGGGDKYNV